MPTRDEATTVSRVDGRYLAVATEMQRWRDFASHVSAYLVMNVIFIGIWALSGKGPFWPAYTLLGWGVGLSFQHFHVVLRGQITDEEVRRRLGAGDSQAPAASEPSGRHPHIPVSYGTRR